MQAPSGKSLAKGRHSEMPQMLSNQSSMTGSESDSSPSSPPTESFTIKSPKVAECRSMRSPRSEGKNMNRMAELESQLSRLQEDLNRSKDQLAISKLQKRRAQRESEVGRKDSEEHQVREISEATEGEPISELLKIGQERDRAWQSELEAVRKQQSSALVAAVDEVRRLRNRCEMLVSSEAAHAEHAEKATAELHDLKLEMAEKSHLFENLKSQVEELQKSDGRYRELIDASHLQLKMAKDTIAAHEYERGKLSEALDLACSKLGESKAQVSELEGRIRRMEDEEMEREKVASSRFKLEYSLMSEEAEELQSALMAAETRYQEEQIRSTLHIQSAYEAAEAIKIGSGLQVTKLELLLKEANSEIDKLKVKLIDKENVLQSLRDHNERLQDEKEEWQDESKQKLKEPTDDAADLKACLADREAAIRSILEENSSLRSEMEKKVEMCHSLELAKMDVGEARAAEEAAAAKLDMATQVAERNMKEARTLGDQLRATRAVNSETEAELHRLKVQMQQWRKAAEMAMAVLSREEEDNGKMAWRTGSGSSFDSDYISLDGNDEKEKSKKKKKKKKSGSMLKQLGTLVKKGQK